MRTTRLIKSNSPTASASRPKSAAYSGSTTYSTTSPGQTMPRHAAEISVLRKLTRSSAAAIGSCNGAVPPRVVWSMKGRIGESVIRQHTGATTRIAGATICFNGRLGRDRRFDMPQSRDSIQDIWGARTPFAGANRWPERVDTRIKEETDRWVQSACVLCSNGCGLDIGVKDGRMVGVRGRASDVVNRGRLGPKGLNGWKANRSADRLTSPLIRRGGALQAASWDEAMELISKRTMQVRERYTASAIGF